MDVESSKYYGKAKIKDNRRQCTGPRAPTTLLPKGVIISHEISLLLTAIILSFLILSGGKGGSTVYFAAELLDFYQYMSTTF